MTNARAFFEKTLPGKLTAERAADLGAKFQFNIDGDSGGSWIVDLTAPSDWVSEGESLDADCTINMKESDFIGILDRSVNPQMAFMMGKIRVSGNLALSLKLPKILS
jgi:putative sterol carrier protein